MVQSINPNQIYFAGNSGDIWITSDGGGTYRHETNIFDQYTTYVYDILPHPTNSSMLAVNMILCVSSCFETVIFSVDVGMNWIPNFDQLVYNDILTWGPAGSPGHLQTEFYGLFWYLVGNDTTIGLLSTTNLTTFTPPLGNEQYSSIVYLSNLEAFMLLSSAPPINLYIVPSAYLKSSFVHQEIIPQTSKTSAIDNIEIVDTSGPIFLAVHKILESNSSLELFVSGAQANQFQLSLDNVFATSYPPQAEILKLQGLQGVFLANRWMDSTRVQTVITSNDGKTWTTLSPPTDELRNCTNCTLQFFGSYDFTGGLYAKTNPYSVGQIIGVAMVGHSLSNDSSLANLYISQDAGVTWNKLRSGSWRFDSSSTTGFIALTKFQQPTTEILYTFDQGETWSTCDIGANSRNLTVDRVTTSLVAPLTNTGVWLVTHWVVNGVTSYSIIHALFNTSVPLCGPSDYEVLSLEGCVLGQETMIRRKKGSSVCRVDTSMNFTFVTPCNCTRNDYICASCFVEGPNGTCLLNVSVVCNSLGNPPSNCTPGGTYMAPNGYVRVQGTKCINDLPILTPNQQPCPTQPEPNILTPIFTPNPNMEIVPNPNIEIVPNPNIEMVPNSVPISESSPTTTSNPPVFTPTSGPVSTPTSGSPVTPLVTPIPSPSSFTSQNGSSLTSKDGNNRLATAGYISLGVILGVILLIVIIVVVVKFFVLKPDTTEMEMS